MSWRISGASPTRKWDYSRADYTCAQVPQALDVGNSAVNFCVIDNDFRHNCVVRSEKCEASKGCCGAISAVSKYDSEEFELFHLSSSKSINRYPLSRNWGYRYHPYSNPSVSSNFWSRGSFSRRFIYADTKVRQSGRNDILKQMITDFNVPVDTVQILPFQLENDVTIIVIITQSLIHKSAYLSRSSTRYWWRRGCKI